MRASLRAQKRSHGAGMRWHTQPGGELVVSTRLPDGRTIRVIGAGVGKVERGMLRWIAWEAESVR